MKIYVAGKWQERDCISHLIVLLEKQGHTITEDWTWHSEKDTDWAKLYSVDDIIGVQNCDIFVGCFVNDYQYEGALAELGAALALEKHCYIIGHAADSCIFMHHPLVKQFETDVALLEWLGS